MNTETPNSQDYAQKPQRNRTFMIRLQDYSYMHVSQNPKKDKYNHIVPFL